MRWVLLLLSLLFSASALADASKFYTTGRQTNVATNTVMATTEALSSGGVLGANYQVSVMLTGSSAMTFKLEVLNAQSNIIQTIYMSAPANDTKLIDPQATFFIPNGYKVQIRNDASGGILGATHQASLILRTKELIDVLN